MTDQEFAEYLRTGKAIGSQVDVMLDGRSGRIRGWLVSVCINEEDSGHLLSECDVLDDDGQQWSADHRHLVKVTLRAAGASETSDIVTRWLQKRADMIGTDDEPHY
jgi:hypothetical protein